jgi:two-component system sensor histidine kinase BaeS
MRARITLAFVTLIALAVLLAGGGALLLVRRSQSVQAQTNVARATEIFVNAAKGSAAVDINKPDVLKVLKQIASLSSESVITLDQNGHLLNGSPSPPGIPKSEIDRQGKSLLTGVVRGAYGGIAYAAAPLFNTKTIDPKHPHTIALVFEATENFSSVTYFLFAGLAALVAAAALAALISRQVATRVVRVAGAAERIAGGNFDVRLAGRRRDYPEIAQLDAAINSMAADLSRSQIQEREFLLSISHDLRTPLTSIRGYAEAIADGAVEDPAHAAKVVLSEAARLERLIGDLLDLARLRAQQFTLELQTIDLGGAAAEASEALKVAFDTVDVALTVDGPPEPVDAVADPHRLSQIVANLLENALKFAASTVTVTVGGSDSTATLAVEDDGPGIDAEDLPHVLDRLFTSDRHAARTSGTGLGLAIVAELAVAMRGSVRVASPTRDGGGTRITLTLPRPGARREHDGAQTS